MLVKSQVKYIQSLGHKKFRDQEGLFIAEGPKLVTELLNAPNTRPVQVFAEKGWLGENASKVGNIPLTEVKGAELEKISSLVTPNQVLAVFKKPSFPTSHPEEGINVLLDGIQDPGNLGTIVRIADWFGIRQITCSRDSADVFNAKTVQSTMGSIARVAVLYGDLEVLIKDTREKHPRLSIRAATLEGKSIFGAGKIEKGMIIFGNESKGIRPEILDLVPDHITIPGRGGAESLNAAVAAGIILSHLVTGTE